MMRSGSSFELLPLLEEEAPLVSDTDLAVTLRQLGVDSLTPLSWANQEAPEQVRQAHRIHKRAGAQVFRTNTAGASLEALKAFGLEDRCEALNNSGRALLKEVLGEQGIHAGVLQALPTAVPALLREAAYGNQAIYLSDTYADLIWLSGFEHLEDARLALRVVRRVSQTQIVLGLKVPHPPPDPNWLTDALPDLLHAGANFLMLQGQASDPNFPQLVSQLVEVVGIVGVEVDELPEASEPSAAFQQTLMALLSVGVAWIALGAHTTPEHTRLVRTLRDA